MAKDDKAPSDNELKRRLIEADPKSLPSTDRVDVPDQRQPAQQIQPPLTTEDPSFADPAEGQFLDFNQQTGEFVTRDIGQSEIESFGGDTTLVILNEIADLLRDLPARIVQELRSG